MASEAVKPAYSLPPERHWLVGTPIAHRGLHGPRVPENSLAAFEAAAREGFAAELDVHLLGDGAVAVFHDADLRRMTGQPGNIARETAGSLRKRWLIGTDQRIPLLCEALEVVGGRAPLLIEVKNESARIGPLEDAVGEMLAGYAGPAAVMSFNPLSVAHFRRRYPGIARGQLSGLFGGPIPTLVKRWLAGMPLNWWTRPHFAACDVELIGRGTDALRVEGLPVLAWTVRTPAERECAARFADNIIFEGSIRPPAPLP